MKDEKDRGDHTSFRCALFTALPPWVMFGVAVLIASWHPKYSLVAGLILGFGAFFIACLSLILCVVGLIFPGSTRRILFCIPGVLAGTLVVWWLWPS